MLTFDETNELFSCLMSSNGQYLSSDIRELKLKLIVDKNKNILFSPSSDGDFSFDDMKSIIFELKSLGYDYTDKIIAVGNPRSGYFTASDCVNLEEIRNIILHFGANLGILAEDLFELDDIINANKKLDEYVNYINSLKVPNENRPLNQLEKFILAYDYVTNFKYHESEVDKSFSRNITSILNGQDIVCVGYSKLLKEICTRLGIECHEASVTVINKETNEADGHMNNIVVLDGNMYYADACWDARHNGDRALKQYNYCLIPMSDKDKVRNCDIYYDEYNILANHANNFNKITTYLAKVESGTPMADGEYNKFSYYFSNTIDNLEIKPLELDYNLPYKEISKLNTLHRQKAELKEVLKYLKKYRVGEPISYEDFEEALYNTYISQGMSEKSSKSLLDRTIESNIRQAKKDFTKHATNLFSTAKIKEIEI